MILSFSVENWMSFRDKVSFSMTASQERQHGKRLSKIKKYHQRLLPITAIYGGNASGKTNFFKALAFAQSLVVRGTQPDNLIPIESFKLDDHSADQPSRFIFELLINETIYEFSFSVTRKEILEEKLILIQSKSETVLYDRRNGKPNFDKSLPNDEIDFLNFAFKGTRANQLFLTNSVSQNIDTFKPISNWFKDTLVLIAPDSRFGEFEHFLDESCPAYTKINEVLPQLDTGIIRLGSEETSLENAPLPSSLKIKLQEEVKEGMAIKLLNQTNNERFIIVRKNNELIVKKLVAYHLKTGNTKQEVKFEIKDESDGSQRVLDLLPLFLELSMTTSSKVYVIDEIDRSLHTVLIRQLIELYLSHCSPNKRSQLLITTHDTLLMDQKLLRRDEMWVTERDHAGVSTLYSFSDFKDVRYDKDIRKSYLQGRMGGIPRVFLDDIKIEN